jgi:hypothetical protein
MIEDATMLRHALFYVSPHMIASVFTKTFLHNHRFPMSGTSGDYFMSRGLFRCRIRPRFENKVPVAEKVIISSEKLPTGSQLEEGARSLAHVELVPKTRLG